METLKVTEQTGPFQSKTTPPKTYYQLLFSDARKSNYFPAADEVPNLKGIDVDVELQQSGQYWNIKTLAVHGVVKESSRSDLAVVMSSPSSAVLRMQCLQLAMQIREKEGSVSNLETIVSYADRLYQYITQ